jgi:peptide/nickel transport system permease protein
MKSRQTPAESLSFRQLTWRRLHAQKGPRRAMRILAFLLLLALLADFLANDKPLYCKLEGQSHFPVLKQYAVDQGWASWPAELARVSWYELDYEQVWWPLVPYSASALDLKNARFRGPFAEQQVASRRLRHWLGTDRLGRDVAAGLIVGTRKTLAIGLVSMGLAALIGIFLGALAGYFGDEHLRVSRARLMVNALALYLAVFYGFIVRGLSLREAAEAGNFLQALAGSLLLMLGIMVLMNLLAGPLKRIPWMAARVRVRLDFWVMRSIEVLNSIPGLLLILAVLAIVRKPSIIYVMLIIGLVQWTGIARFVRAEVMKLRNLDYIEAARLLGYHPARIILRHLLPNALGPVLVALAFGVASAILTEASLSFLGLGGSPDQITWGTMLSQARQSFSAWWMALFPGFSIFLTVMLFNTLGEGLSQALGRRT